MLPSLCIFILDNCLTHKMMYVVFFFEFAKINFRMNEGRLVLIMQLGTQSCHVLFKGEIWIL